MFKKVCFSFLNHCICFFFNKGKTMSHLLFLCVFASFFITEIVEYVFASFFHCFCFLNLEICFFFLNSSFLKKEYESLIPSMHLSGNQYLIGPYFMTTIKELLNFYPRESNALYNSIDATC